MKFKHVPQNSSEYCNLNVTLLKIPGYIPNSIKFLKKKTAAFSSSHAGTKYDYLDAIIVAARRTPGENMTS